MTTNISKLTEVLIMKTLITGLLTATSLTLTALTIPAPAEADPYDQIMRQMVREMYGISMPQGSTRQNRYPKGTESTNGTSFGGNLRGPETRNTQITRDKSNCKVWRNGQVSCM